MSSLADDTARRVAQIRRRRAGAILAAASFSVIVGLAVTSSGWDPAVTSTASTESLTVEGLQVSPMFSTSPGTFTVQGELRNAGTRPARQVSIGLSAADPGRDNRWIPLQMQPRGPISILGPGDAVPFYGAVRLEGSGRFSIGVAVLTQDAALPPRLRPVWLLRPGDAATEAAGVFVIYALLLALAVLAVRLLAWRARGIVLQPARRRVALAVVLMLLGPTAVWTARAFAIRTLGPGAPPWIWAELPWIGSLVFAAGWMLVGAAMRPGGSASRGLALAGILYVVVGLLWTFALQLTFGRPLAAILGNADLLLFGLQWPLQVAQVTGLFGLSF